MPMVQVRCRDCGHVWEVDKLSVKLDPIRQCPVCRYFARPEMLSNNGGRSDDYRRSKLQEKRAEKRYGARRQPASGAMPHAKADLRDPGRLRVECKLTRARSYTLKLDDLKKLEREKSADEHPVFEIEFQCEKPFRRYVVIPQWLYSHLAEEDEC
jgi:ribosomal protein L44E